MDQTDETAPITVVRPRREPAQPRRDMIDIRESVDHIHPLDATDEIARVGRVSGEESSTEPRAGAERGGAERRVMSKHAAPESGAFRTLPVDPIERACASMSKPPLVRTERSVPQRDEEPLAQQRNVHGDAVYGAAQSGAQTTGRQAGTIEAESRDRVRGRDSTRTDEVTDIWPHAQSVSGTDPVQPQGDSTRSFGHILASFVSVVLLAAASAASAVLWYAVAVTRSTRAAVGECAGACEGQVRTGYVLNVAETLQADGTRWAARLLHDPMILGIDIPIVIFVLLALALATRGIRVLKPPLAVAGVVVIVSLVAHIAVVDTIKWATAFVY